MAAVQVAVTSGAGALAALPHRLSGSTTRTDVVTADDSRGGTDQVGDDAPPGGASPASAHMGAAGMPMVPPGAMGARAKGAAKKSRSKSA